MATYVPGVPQYLPEFKPFTPDYKFLSNVLDTKTNRYNTNYKQINDLYSKVVYGDLSRRDTQDMRSHFTEQLGPQLQKAAGSDLSVMKNAEAAQAIFKPYFEEDIIVRDLVATRKYKEDMGYAKMLQDSPSEEQRDLYWGVGVQKMNYEMEDFINSSEQEALTMRLPSYVPNANLYERGLEYLKAQEYDVSIDQITKDWIITRKNGDLITKQALEDMKAAFQDDPLVVNAYRAQSFVDSRKFAEQAINAGQASNVREGQMMWANETISNYERILAAQNIKLKGQATQLRGLSASWDAYQKEQGIIPNSSEDKSMRKTQSDLQATIDRINGNENAIADNRGDEDPNLDALLNRAYQLTMSSNIGSDLIAAAKNYGKTHGSVSFKANEFGVQARRMAFDKEMKRLDRALSWNKALLKEGLLGGTENPLAEKLKNSLRGPVFTGNSESIKEDPKLEGGKFADAQAAEESAMYSTYKEEITDIIVQMQTALMPNGGVNKDGRISFEFLGPNSYTPKEAKQKLMQMDISKINDYVSTVLSSSDDFSSGGGPYNEKVSGLIGQLEKTQLKITNLNNYHDQRYNNNVKNVLDAVKYVDKGIFQGTGKLETLIRQVGKDIKKDGNLFIGRKKKDGGYSIIKKSDYIANYLKANPVSQENITNLRKSSSKFKAQSGYEGLTDLQKEMIEKSGMNPEAAYNMMDFAMGANAMDTGKKGKVTLTAQNYNKYAKKRAEDMYNAQYSLMGALQGYQLAPSQDGTQRQLFAKNDLKQYLSGSTTLDDMAIGDITIFPVDTERFVANSSATINDAEGVELFIDVLETLKAPKQNISVRLVNKELDDEQTTDPKAKAALNELMADAAMRITPGSGFKPGKESDYPVLIEKHSYYKSPDKSAYAVTFPSKNVNEITSKGSKTGEGSILPYVKGDVSTTFIVEFPKDKDAVDFQSSAVYNALVNDSNNSLYKSYRGGDFRFYLDQNNQVMLDIQQKVYDAKQDAFIVDPSQTVNTNLTEKIMSQGKGVNTLDDIYSTVIDQMIQNSAVQTANYNASKKLKLNP